MVIVYPRLILLVSTLSLALYFWGKRYDPQRIQGTLVRRSLLGLALLVGWNLLPVRHLGINPLSTLLAGSLGIPGLGLLSAFSAIR